MLADIKPGDLFIADYHLDGTLTGLDVLEQLRNRQHREVPAILLSGDMQSMMRVVKTLDSALPLSQQAGRYRAALLDRSRGAQAAECGTPGPSLASALE